MVERTLRIREIPGSSTSEFSIDSLLSFFFRARNLHEISSFYERVYVCCRFFTIVHFVLNQKYLHEIQRAQNTFSRKCDQSHVLKTQRTEQANYRTSLSAFHCMSFSLTTIYLQPLQPLRTNQEPRVRKAHESSRKQGNTF